VAAHKQGKFWPFNEKIWHFGNLTPAGMEKAAKRVASTSSAGAWTWTPKTSGARRPGQVRRQRPRHQRHTEHYINGRKYNDPLDIASLRDWIDEELGR